MKTANPNLSPSIYTRLQPDVLEAVRRQAERNERSIAAEIRFLVRQAIEGNAETEEADPVAESA